jgi:hypothetical protein
MRAQAGIFTSASLISVSVLVAAQGPPAAVMARDQQLAQLAVESARRPTLDPIPLKAGDRVVGEIYDQFFLGVAVARAAAASGVTVDPATVQASAPWRSHRMVIVALPTDCDGKPDRPLAIRFVPGVTIPVKLADPAPALRGDASGELLPGVTLPADTLVEAVATMPLINAHVEVDYAEPFCHGAAKSESFTVTTAPGLGARGINALKLPEGSTDPSPTTVRVSALLDLDGRPRFMSLVQGPADLATTAMAALGAARFTPTMINGVPAPLSVMAPVVFTSSGAPGPVAAPVPPPGSTGMSVTTFTTTAPIQPTPSPPIPVERREALVARLAIDSASAAPAPISIDVDGSKRHGVFLDRFLMQVLAARDAAASGRPYDPLSPPAGFATKNSLVVAMPLDCGHSVLPTSIQLMGDSGPVLRVGSALTDADLTAAAGAPWPAGAMGQLFATSGSTNASQSVVIAYAEPACDATTVTMKLQRDPPHTISSPPRAPAPPGVVLALPTTVHVQGIMDTSGTPRYLVAIDGPPELAASAVVAGTAWRFQPSRLNGIATPIPLTLDIFFLPNANSSAPSTGPAPTASSTGRGSHDTTTPDAPGLDAASSKCSVATDETYGMAPASPVKIGGGAMAGPAREQQYVSALRGPMGQGLHFVRLGSVMGPDRTILDMYEISYAGLPQAVRIYVDEYRAETLQAPHGFTCATPLDIK